ncbi:MAG: transketolase [Propionibacteriaceae bacterium]|jgi:transketolase|nr:transketolase [Propionibacteriaceae bacterium]
MTDLTWTVEDARAVDTARILAADAVQQAGNGHPGSAISLASVAYLLYQKVMHTDPTDPQWLGRDRFVLSAGHESVLQYVALYLAGCGIGLDDLKQLRTWGSKTPGHPEYGHTDFVEITTGPLGAGISNAVGMAMAARRQRGLLEPDAAPGESLFDHFVFALSGDGCLQEGVALEAISLAGTQRLGNLILIYDDNDITIEGDTKIAFTEDVLAKFAACGWHTAEVDWRNGGAYHEDMAGLYDAIRAAQTVEDRPSVIKLNTIIGWPLPNKQGSESIHGAAVGTAEISALKALLDFEDVPFAIDEDLVARLQLTFAARAALTRQVWDSRFTAWREDNPERASLLWRLSTRALPANLTVPTFEPGKMSTRKASGKVLDALAGQLPELWGGSADLAGSNLTTMTGEPSFLPSDRVSDEWPGGPYGRTLHFGIREHAMGGIMNGMAAEGLTRPYGGTFFVFSDYMRPAVRLAALMKLPVIYVWTHDSIGVGEDGPTHQPVEHLASYRAIPGLAIIRPADANETAVCWKQALIRCDGPNALVLSRQDLRTVDRSLAEFAPAELAAKGGYVLRDARAGAVPQVIVLATGSEVEVALDAQDALEAAGVPTRVVSLPCFEWFEEQPLEYRESVLPPKVKARVSIEAGISLGWQRYVGDSGRSVSLEHFGASAAGELLFREFGLTVAAVVEAAKAQL